ncbi:erythromycin esterase family protein [Clostridium sp. OS1-26]|uniref:erythromycin esterase family protein n=1 Tax=Clostridium sp. OS1-26 TaxID=3070681 RepID=UPI0027DF91F4|nr:erythromycin esterase family protein [Clostridium sp. OS1-26]WML33637.1 erythromycin esterase family protein [Clostridium sp. OS1-26]
MFEFLVEKMGYRLFAIEAEFGGAQDVNDYILYGKGNAEDAIKSMKFWTWSTEEVVDMVEWMRNYNENPEHKTKIKFYGFDMQSGDKNSARVLEYIKKVDNNKLSEFKGKLSDVNDNLYSLDKEKLENIKKGTEQLKNIFEEKKQDYVNKSSISEYEKVLQDLNVINQCVEYVIITKTEGWGKASNTRDHYMAQNAKWILDYEKQFGNDKIMLWAHNGHITKKISNYKSMGQNLKEMFNDEYYAIGFDFYQGSFRAIPCDSRGQTIGSGLAKFNISSSDSNSFAYSFEKTGVPLSFIDFKSASKDTNVSAWLSQKQLIHSIGAIYNGRPNQWMLPEVPIESYDGLIFVKKTTAAIGIKGYETKIEDGDAETSIYKGIFRTIKSLTQ